MRTGICGVGGRMGLAILKITFERGNELAAAFDHESSVFFGNSVSILTTEAPEDIIINSINSDDLEKVDVVIDFSSPSATMELLELAVKQKKPLVIGTTGLSDEQILRIQDASEKIPILFSPNMSMGVNLLFKLTEVAATALQNEFDIEVFEAHHRFKKDSPSGTAKRLVEVIKESVSDLHQADEVYGREGLVGERKDKEIGVMAMRGGDIVGEHTVFFAGMGERIELTHRATNRDTFARGSVLAAEFLCHKGAGFYSMFDVLGF